MQAYYRIGQAAALLGVSPSALRNWERLGLLKPPRTSSKYRLYSRDALKELKRISYLRKVKRINLPGIRQLIHAREPTDTPSAPAGGAGTTAIVERLAHLRQERGLTLAEVAASTGLSAGYVSAVERGRANPSIATLQKLASLYRSSVLALFGDRHTVRRLVRPRDRWVLRPEPGVQLELLALGTGQMEPHLFRLAPKTSSGGAYRHEGEEFLYLLQGKLEIWLDDIERYVLEPGDSLYFSSSQPHRWRTLSQGETVLLWINTPPSF